MKRRAKSNRTDASASASPGPADETFAETPAVLPSRAVGRAVSLLLLIHLVAVGLSLVSVVEPSATQATLLGWAQPYLRMTRFGIDGRPIYLAHADQSEQPLRVQISRVADPEETDWRTVEPPGGTGWMGRPGLAASDRYHRWLAAALLVESEQPGLAAELILAVAEQNPEARAVRIVRLPTELNTVLDDAEPPPYVARVIRQQDYVSLVHVPPADKNSVAVPPPAKTESPGQGERP